MDYFRRPPSFKVSLRRRRRRKRLSHLRVMRERPVAANQTWAVDFIHDSLISGRRFRAFAVFDQWSRESLDIEVDCSLTGERVVKRNEILHWQVPVQWRGWISYRPASKRPQPERSDARSKRARSQ